VLAWGGPLRAAQMNNPRLSLRDGCGVVLCQVRVCPSGQELMERKDARALRFHHGVIEQG
jgi:hypothetical protein